MSMGRRRQRSLLKQRVNSFSWHIVLFRPPVKAHLTHNAEGTSSVICLSIQMLIFSKTPSQTHPKIMFYQFPWPPLPQSSWHKTLIITIPKYLLFLSFLFLKWWVNIYYHFWSIFDLKYYIALSSQYSNSTTL